MEFLYLIIGCLLGFALGWFISKAGKSGIGAIPESEYEKIKNELKEERERVLRLTEQKTSVETLLNTQKTEIETIRDSFTKEFENLANKIFEDKSKKFTDQNKANIETLLNPLKSNIEKFEKKVDDTYKAEASERNSLKGEIKTLILLNKQISEEAGNLAKALKGDTKKQGNWGEIILEKVLERSGLQKGVEYEIQESITGEDGKRLQPDVVIHLPDKKHIIVDSKVSLTAYNDFVNATEENEASKYLQAHITSVKNHIKGLSEKNYQSAGALNTPDFVLLFMPIESSFSLAVQADNELFNYAWERKIVIVSPSTLLATLRTIASLWKQERQTRNAIEIAEEGGKLYDKFVSFVNDLILVGKKMDDAKSSYSDAMKKLHEGSGNLVKRTEKMKQMGAKATKEIPKTLLDRADET